MSNYTQQLQKMKTHPRFIAALNQSGGSTPKALLSYGIKANAWSKMHTRIITSPSFTGERIFQALRKTLNGSRRPAYYLAIPPTMFESVVEHLEKSGCTRALASSSRSRSSAISIRVVTSVEETAMPSTKQGARVLVE